MPKVAKELSPAEVRRITDSGMHAVGGVSGLMLKVNTSGGRSWILRARVGNRRRDFGLGGFPTVPLSSAREKARELRDKLGQGIDPVAERKAAIAAHIAAQARAVTFKQAATRCHAAKADGFKSAKHSREWLATLERYAFPVIGALPVADVDVTHIQEVLRPIWSTRTETASRVRQRMETVLSWSEVHKYREGANPARWRGNLDELFAKPTKVTRRRHWPALPWQRMPEFMADLRSRGGVATRALEFAILTAARSGEVRSATWGEIDMQARIWTVPAEKMKAGKPHRVPLPKAAVELLEGLPRLSDLVFPAPRGGQLSDAALSAVVKRMHDAEVKAGRDGYPDPTDGRVAVPHGFRSSFKDWCRNNTSAADEVSELALAHVNSDATRAAYARDGLLPQRTRLMTQWAKYCAETPKPASVTAIQGMRKA
jgi:integrase